MDIEIISPEAIIFKGSAKSVKLPGESGGFEILNNHAAIVSNLKKGVIIIKDENNSEHKFEINSGVVEMKTNTISILAN